MTIKQLLDSIPSTHRHELEPVIYDLMEFSKIKGIMKKIMEKVGWAIPFSAVEDITAFRHKGLTKFVGLRSSMERMEKRIKSEYGFVLDMKEDKHSEALLKHLVGYKFPLSKLASYKNKIKHFAIVGEDVYAWGVKRKSSEIV